MSIPSLRARRSVRVLSLASASTALVLGLSGSASACTIGEFSAAAVCDGSQGVIVVTDEDSSATPATVTVFLQENGADVKQVGEQTVRGSGEGTKVTFTEDWQPNATYRVHVKTDNGAVDDDVKDLLTTPSEGCAPEQSPTPTPTPSATTPVESPTPTPSPSGRTVPPKAPHNAPSPGVGGTHLAETGADSSTGTIAGIAAALVVAGGAVFLGLRRRGTAGGR
ncbi:LAETG motif-containing sortase-dependent surface protein [Streptomyces sp. NPDC101237]|uniref:LAETG motif-containing sortase-dependent surface protein n=1 Tax=Streptomyces sp. NPDC101237 TaxID=3366139 RepID=UPI00381DA50A